MGSPFFMFHGLVAGGWDGVGLRLGEEGFRIVEFVFWHFAFCAGSLRIIACCFDLLGS